MPKKIAFIGAGSFTFTRTLINDILTFPALADAELALMDIDAQRLAFIEKAARKIVAKGNYPATVTATLSREDALMDADGVIITILSGGVQVFRKDIEIPMKYGVDICIGDTRGPAGIFRFLRTAGELLSICRDAERLCPNAIILNYTNPMAMLCRLCQSETKVTVTGLCHSVQRTAKMLADWIGADMENVSYLCAGINHQAFYLEFKENGVDAYPRLRAAMENPAILNAEQVRNEMFLKLDYYVTESSGHNSEYNAWFRKRPDLIEKYCTHGTNRIPGDHGFVIKKYLRQEDTWQSEIDEWLEKEDIELTRGHEYAAYIFNAVFGDNTLFEFNGNVRNFGLIDNLPEGCCVEVPVLACRDGLRPIHVGTLPDQLAILNDTAARCEELAVKGYLNADRRMIYRAIAFDPLTAAVLSLSEIQAMVDEMFEANREYLPQFF